MSPDDWTVLITLVVIVGGAVLLIAWDIYATIKYGGTATISWNTWIVSKKYPIIPFSVGFIMGLLSGHLFWVQQSGK